MKKIFKNLAVFLSATIIITSCDTVDFGDINDNPNGPTSPITSQLLTSAQSDVATLITDVRGICYVQHITEGQYPGPSRYQNVEFSYDSWYVGPIQNLNKIIEVNEDPELAESVGAYGNNDNQIAASKILRAYFLNYMTDRWGYLPWTEAFQGVQGTQPKFDSQEFLYNYIFDEINDALSKINSGSGPSGDVMFGGDMDKWATFGNTLKLVLALRVSDADPVLAKTNFESAVASGKLVSTNADNVVFTFGSDDNSDNPWEDRFESREDYIMSETLMEALRSELDPRLFKFSQPSRTGSATPAFPGNTDEEYVGGPNGKVNGNVPDYSFITGTVIDDQTYPIPILTLAQVKFSLAEVSLRFPSWNFGGGTTASLFKEGIEASMEQWGVDSADITSYTAAHTTSTMTEIAYEKWVALFLNGSEAWSEWRRLDAPALTPSIYATDQRIPVRHGYDSSIQDNNAENYAAAVAAQGPDTNHTKLWWDKN